MEIAVGNVKGVSDWGCVQLMWMEEECHFSRTQKEEITKLVELWHSYLDSLGEDKASSLEISRRRDFGFKRGWYGSDIFMYGPMIWNLFDPKVQAKCSEKEQLLLAQCEHIFRISVDRVVRIGGRHSKEVPLLMTCRLILGSPEAPKLPVETVDLLTNEKVEILFGGIG